MSKKLGEGGELLKDLGMRDALHAPYVMVFSEMLRPGDDVRFTDASMSRAVICDRKDRHGVVDPFARGYYHGESRPLLYAVLIDPKFVGDLTHSFGVNLPGITPEAVPPTPVSETIDAEDAPDLSGGTPLGSDEFDSADAARCHRKGC